MSYFSLFLFEFDDSCFTLSTMNRWRGAVVYITEAVGEQPALSGRKDITVDRHSARQKALYLTRAFHDIMSGLGHKAFNYYELLWIAHWSIETHGLEVTKATLEEIMLSPGFKPEKAPMLLRDTLLARDIQHDRMGEWFVKAMNT